MNIFLENAKGVIKRKSLLTTSKRDYSDTLTARRFLSSEEMKEIKKKEKQELEKIRIINWNKKQREDCFYHFERLYPWEDKTWLFNFRLVRIGRPEDKWLLEWCTINEFIKALAEQYKTPKPYKPLSPALEMEQYYQEIDACYKYGGDRSYTYEWWMNGFAKYLGKNSDRWKLMQYVQVEDNYRTKKLIDFFSKHAKTFYKFIIENGAFIKGLGLTSWDYQTKEIHNGNFLAYQWRKQCNPIITKFLERVPANKGKKVYPFGQLLRMCYLYTIGKLNSEMIIIPGVSIIFGGAILSPLGLVCPLYPYQGSKIWNIENLKKMADIASYYMKNDKQITIKHKEYSLLNKLPITVVRDGCFIISNAPPTDDELSYWSDRVGIEYGKHATKSYKMNPTRKDKLKLLKRKKKKDGRRIIYFCSQLYLDKMYKEADMNKPGNITKETTLADMGIDLDETLEEIRSSTLYKKEQPQTRWENWTMLDFHNKIEPVVAYVETDKPDSGYSKDYKKFLSIKKFKKNVLIPI